MADWLKWTLLGALSIVFGILALNYAALTSLSVTVLVGAFFIVAGIAQAVAGFGEEGGGAKALSILLGVVMAVLGASFLVNPFAGTVSLSILVTALIAASGVLRLIHAWDVRGTSTFWMMGVAGVASLVLAAFVLLNPQVTVILLGIVLGVELLVNGLALVALGLHKRGRRRDEAPRDAAHDGRTA
jgi:uncharacterized membrane protein HdeD (DUF308 family)